VTAATVLTFVLGLALLIAGAELLVRGASRLAAALGVSPLVIGLTVVAYGTSSPEMAVSVDAALRGQTDMALGNVVGSNIFNVLFILGASALVTPLVVHQQLVRVDVPIMIGVTALAMMFAQDGVISRAEGGWLLAGMVAYTGFAIWMSRRESAAVRAEYAEAYGDAAPARHRWMGDAALAIVGLALLMAGARMFTGAAVEFARAAGVSELVIGLTIVAAGTSMPEVAASLTAALRGERDIAVGNVVGSNIFNVLAVLGAAATVAPGGVPVAPAALAFDLPAVVAVSFACLPIFVTGFAIGRWEGGVFLAYYGAYVLYLYLDGSGHTARATYAWAMLSFVLPLTALTLMVVAGRELLRRRERTAA
jgi:cation:H+ antiporter